MGLGELGGFMQHHLGLSGVRTLGGTWNSAGSIMPSAATSWNSGLTRTIHGTSGYGTGTGYAHTGYGTGTGYGSHPTSTVHTHSH